LSAEVLEGIGHAGTAHNTHRWRELSFLIALVRDWKELPPEMQAQQRKDHEAFCAFLDKVPSVDGRQLRQILRIRPVCLPCLRDGVGDSVHH
jgi:5-methylcytosine-specific restriction protein B